MPPNIHSKEVCTALIAALKSSICGVHTALRNGTCKLHLRPYAASPYKHIGCLLMRIQAAANQLVGRTLPVSQHRASFNH